MPCPKKKERFASFVAQDKGSAPRHERVVGKRNNKQKLQQHNSTIKQEDIINLTNISINQRVLYGFCLLYLLCSAPLKPRRLILLSVVTKVCKYTILTNSSAGEKITASGISLFFFLFSFCSPTGRNKASAYR